MTRLNWDKVNKENLLQRRGGGGPLHSTTPKRLQKAQRRRYRKTGPRQWMRDDSGDWLRIKGDFVYRPRRKMTSVKQQTPVTSRFLTDEEMIGRGLRSPPK